ncbi:unnamed protein product [Miscanthus lutarioriparius]|uniref:Prefoldin subunit 6 n=1 Tax=Miscanthus lutarioriparius TaxID=422564 RepID=A0A811PVM9_9POAL|nr:unnamed protein product [Miscanthus lutarioriparius]
MDKWRSTEPSGGAARITIHECGCESWTVWSPMVSAKWRNFHWCQSIAMLRPNGRKPSMRCRRVCVYLAARPFPSLGVPAYDIAKNHQVRKQYTIQVGENELVLKELELLGDGANVYKLIGPVLVKQDLAEAKANVKKRIEYISAELKRMDRALKDLEEKQNSKKESIFKLQQRMQAVQAKA